MMRLFTIITLRALYHFLVVTVVVPSLWMGYSYAEEQDIPEVNWVAGPKKVSVGKDLAELQLSKDYLFLNGEDTRKLMKYAGEPTDGDEQGLILPNKQEKDWSIVINYSPLGYVKDDEAKNLDADKILKSITEATEEGNKEREKLGSSPLHIKGWAEKPHYDSHTHHLTWSLLADGKEGEIVNYNTRVLGRSGVTSITLVTSPEELKEVKSNLEKIVSNYQYIKGKKYTDFIPGKDKVAEIGMAALIIGGTAAAAKSGILAKIFLFLMLLFKKLWIIVFLGALAFFKKIFSSVISFITAPFSRKESTFDSIKSISTNNRDRDSE